MCAVIMIFAFSMSLVIKTGEILVDKIEEHNRNENEVIEPISTEKSNALVSNS